MDVGFGRDDILTAASPIVNAFKPGLSYADETSLSTFSEKFVHLGHDGEGIGNIEHIGLALGPAAISVGVDRTAFIDKASADHVRFFAVTAGVKTLRVTRRGTGLANLVEMTHTGKHGFPLGSLIDKRLAAPE